LLSALAALREVYGQEPVVFRMGASVPAVEIMKRILGLDSVLLGFACPDENFHAPNEFLRLDNFDRGPRTVTRFWADAARRWNEPGDRVTSTSGDDPAVPGPG
jgi:acetylornithine deacetylase/succinyl-diaminopimelate desuccinylase-like protein